MLEYLQYYAEFLRPLDLAHDALPTFSEATICWALGRIKEPWSPDIIYFCSPWSGSAGQQGVYAENEMPRILVQTHKYLSSQVPVASDKILAKANGIPILKAHNPCRKCVSQGESILPHHSSQFAVF